MARQLRKFLGIAGLGINWAILWGLALVAGMGTIRVFRPQDVQAGEGLLSAVMAGGLAGLVSGTLFGLIIALAEDRKPIAELRVPRIALWGALASAVWPLLHRHDPGMILAFCLLGGCYAAVSVALARKLGIRRFSSSYLFTVLGRSVRDPLRAACAPK
jgi:hypothetical protein